MRVAVTWRMLAHKLACVICKPKTFKKCLTGQLAARNQVKLAEALNISRTKKNVQNLVAGADMSEASEQPEKPDALRAKICLEVLLEPPLLICHPCDRFMIQDLTGACMCLRLPDQLLRELGDALTPFRGVIETLRSELALCIFSDYYVSTGGSDTFEQVCRRLDALACVQRLALTPCKLFLTRLVQSSLSRRAREPPSDPNHFGRSLTLWPSRDWRRRRRRSYRSETDSCGS